MKTSIRNSITTILGLAALSSTVLGSTSASAETAPAKMNAGPATEYCRIVVDRAKPGEEFSRVVTRKCSDNRADLEINAQTLLMTWYEHTAYGGRSTVLEGSYGPCDSEGYRVRSTGQADYDWLFIISSFKVWNKCVIVHAWAEQDFQGDNIWFYGNRENVGDTMNDRIRSLTIQSW
ncbi:hypothetical protein [Actinomadura sp. 3N407]|uniref:hypothetical protein n=1 Tax=Actinomadura sp. 3N407 TaxID=3457423 RepID=UPI003FCE381A